MPASCARITYKVETGKQKPSVHVRAIGEFGTELGDLAAGLEWGGAAFTVGGVSVHRDYRRCGIATRLYELAAAAACGMGYKLASDSSRSTQSQGFWEKQVKKGRAQCVATADPAVAEREAEGGRRPSPGPRYGRGDCDRYELTACPVTSLAGRRRKR